MTILLFTCALTPEVLVFVRTVSRIAWPFPTVTYAFGIAFPSHMPHDSLKLIIHNRNLSRLVKKRLVVHPGEGRC